MAKFAGPSVIPGATPILPTDQVGTGEFADLFEDQGTPAEAPESPVETQGLLPLGEPGAPITGEPGAVTDIPEAVATPPVTEAAAIPTAVVPNQALSEEQRARERVPTYKEKLRRTTLEPASSQVEQPLELALARANNVNTVVSDRLAGSKMTGAQRVANIQAGFPEAAFAREEGVAQVPALRDSNVNVGVQALLYDPRQMNAGILDPNTGLMGLDPEFGRILGLATEGWFFNQMEASEDVQAQMDTDVDPAGMVEQGEAAQGGQVFSKAQGNQRLGREIWQAYQRQRAQNEGRATDEYLSQLDELTPDTFTFIGDMAKEVYADANPDMVFRDDSKVGEPGGQVYYQITEQGARVLNQLSEAAKGLMATPEVAPLTGVSPTAQPLYEGRTRVREVTTKVGDLKDWSVVQEAMANYHSVAYVNDPRRERVGLLMGMLALINHKNPNNQVYADMFKIGNKELEALQGEKRRLFMEADLEKDPERAEEKRKLAELYNPIKILAANREKFLNVAGGIAQYSGRANYLTFAMQALTGRTHVQQTVYNPSAHKFVRFVVGGGNVFTFKPRSGSELDTTWKEIIAALVLEASDGTAGSKLSTRERLKLFDEQIGNERWKTLVAFGNELKTATANFDVDKAKQAVLAIRQAPDVEQANQIKQQVVQDFSQDPLSDGLKAELAKHGDEGLHYIDLLIDIANYQQAIDNKTPFSSTITAEMDGKTHGPATNAGLLGIQSMAKRTGLIVEQDYSNTDWLDSRKAMGEWMNDNAEQLVQTAPSNQRPYLKDILALAVKDTQNFLKKSPMTMGYGQELTSLRMHVNTTAYSGPMAQQIATVAKAGGISLPDAVNFLHTALVDSIFEIMDPKVVAVGRLMRANAFLSVLSNELLYFDNAMGFRSYAAGKQMDPEASTTASFEFRKTEDKPKKHVTVQLYKEKAEGAAERGEIGPGGWTMGRILPVAVQSYDGNMISRTGSGTSWNRISSEAKRHGAKPFVLPIFDAFVTDLGSFQQVRREANANWLRGLEQHSYVESIARDWFNETTATLREKANDPTNTTMVSQEEPGAFRGLFHQFKTDDKGDSYLRKSLSKILQTGAKPKGMSLDDYSKLLKRQGLDIEASIRKEMAARGITINETDKISPQQAYAVVDIIVKAINLRQRNAAAVTTISKDKKELLSKVTGKLTQMDL